MKKRELFLLALVLFFGSFSIIETSLAAAQITSFQLTSSVSGTLPFTVGLGFKKGDITSSPVLDIPASQVIVKSRWNDNSVKHAVASGRVDLTAGAPKTINVLSSGASSGTNLTASDIQTANPSASVQLGSIGTVNLSGLLANPFRTWISGPEMVEAHYRSPVGSDPTLVVWFYVRLYKNGQVWVRVVVENGYVDVTANSKTYAPVVIIGGATVYSSSSITQYAHTRWTVDGWIGGDPRIIPKLDTNYLIDTKLVPNYWKRNPSSSALDGLYQSYSPMQNGNWTVLMGTAGYQRQIGLLPIWDALYLTSGADARAYRSVLANANALNSYSIVWNDSSTKLPTMPSSRPTWTVYGDGGGGATIYAAGPLVWDNAHHGSGGYLAYLITGDYYYLETMEDQSSLCYLTNGSYLGSGTSRYLRGETRAVAWCARTIGQLAGIGPSDPIVNDYRTLLANNVLVWNSQVQRSGQNLLGYLYSYEIVDNSYGAYGPGSAAPWQQHFWVQTYGYLSDLELFSDMTIFNSVRNYLDKSIVGILGPVGTDNYCYTEAAGYTIRVSPGSADSTTWYDSWGEVFQMTTGRSNTSCGSTLSGGTDYGSTGYWGNLMPAIAYAVDHGAPGAAAAWNRMTSATNWSVVENSGFNDVPIWGIVPRVSSVSPPPPPPPPPPTGGSADLNSDSRVNSVDAAILMGAWGQTSRPPADINKDGIVNSVDASLLMGQWTL